ncbi:MAG: DUF2142 domain-containing protein [Hungatella sp.]|nr:DUF2142 domain-containing protein [Hungatella sp.]
MKKRNNRWLLGPALVLAAGVWHYFDVRAGALESGDTWLTGTYLWLLAAVVLGLVGLGYGFTYGPPELGGRTETGRKASSGRKGKLKAGPWSLEYGYLCAGLFLGTLYLLVLPPLSAPDEVSHYVTAYQLSSRMLGRPSNADTGHVLSRAQDMWLQDVGDDYEYEAGEDGYLRPVAETTENAWPLGQTLTEDTYKVIRQQGLGGRRWPSAADNGDQLMVSVYPPVVTTAAAYIPQALGISIARVLNLNSICLVYLGRFLNLLFFVAMTFLSIKRLPFGKEVMMGAALLPMTIHLSASFSYDVMIMGCVFYLTAICLDLAYEKDRVRLVDVAVLALLMAAAGPCKMVYGVLMGLCLLIPVKKFGGWKRWAAAAAGVAAAWGVSMAMVNGQTIVSYAVRTEGDVPWAQEAGYSLTLLLHEPMRLARMFYQTFLWQAEQYHLSMIGAWLGNLDDVLDVPYIAVLLFTGCLLCLAAKKPGESIRFPFGARVWVWVLCGGCAGVILLSMLIAWTPLSSPVISGVQGRYFLPFLPVLLMSLKNDFIILTKNGNRSILYLMCCANGYVLTRLYAIVSMRL